MSFSTVTSILFLVLAVTSCTVGAFSLAPMTSRGASSALAMAKFDKTTEKWIATTEDEKSGGYGPFGTLIR